MYEKQHEESSAILAFNCCQEHKQTNEKTFFNYKDVGKFLNYSSASDSKCFGLELHQDMHDDENMLESMFNKACLSYNIIKSISENNPSAGMTTTQAERYNITNFLQVIRNSNFQDEKIQNKLQVELSLLYNRIGPLSSIKRGTRHFDIFYHLIHGHLDWKWLILTSLLKLETQPNRYNVIVEGTKFERLFKIILYDLLQFAITSFNRVKVADLYKILPFPCVCFKEFLMLLHTLLENYNISFWNQINMCLRLIEDGTNIYEIYNDAVLNRHFKKEEIQNFELFTIWIYSYLSHAIELDDDLELSNSSSTDSDYELLEKLTNSFLLKNPSEQELRIYLFNLKDIVNKWEPKVNVVMAFWDYFHKLLNSSFSLPGATVSFVSSAGVSNSEGILENIKKNCNQQKMNANQTSFTMFTIILTCLIEKLKRLEKQTKIDKILGRIYSRLPHSKLFVLTETGLNNTATLLISLCLAINNREILNKVCDIVVQYPLEMVNELRQTCAIKIHLMLVMLLIENNVNVESYLDKLLGRVNEINKTDKEDSSFHILKVMFDGFLSIFQNEGPFTLGEHILFGPWIINYLNHASVLDLDRLFELTNRILLQIRGSDDEDSEKIYKSIYDNIFPFVKKNFATINNSQYMTTLASNLYACCRDQSKFEEILKDFVEIECKDIERFLQFWVNVIKSENALYIKQSLIIKCWIKCCVLTVNEEEDTHLKKFSQYTFELDEFKEICGDSLQDSTQEFTSKHYLHSFFHRIGTTFTNATSIIERSRLIDKFQYYFMDFEKWVPPHTIHTSREFTLKLFKLISNLILYCGAIAYQRQKNNIFNIVMDKYVMPASLLMGRKTPDVTMTQSIHYVFPLIVYGISKLDYTKDAQLKMYLNNLIEKWFPHFNAVSRKTDVIVKPFIHISKKCDGQMLSFLCKKLAFHFITVKDSRQPHEQACLAIEVIKEMFTAVKVREEDEKLCILVESTLYDLMVHAFRTNEGTSSNKSSLLYFVEISEFMKTEQCPMQIKNAYMDSMRNLVKSYLSYQTEACFKFFIRIIRLNPANGMELLEVIKTEFSELEKIRKNDGFLQNLYIKFEKTILEILCIK